MKVKSFLTLATLSLLIFSPAFAQETGDLSDFSRFFASSIAFAAAAIGAGLAVGKAGSSGLAATAERPEMRTTAIIITALGEAIAIYGIVVAILILGS
jgi:F0F1-type ATP synthase membrane subunit c/vacuolar-type H+-ATPase subunit K